MHDHRPNRGKTKEWNRVRAQLKKEFEAKGITRCEVCNASFPLGFAHRYKRRFIIDETELRICALLCNPCHHRIEYGGNMFEEINKIIADRECSCGTPSDGYCKACMLVYSAA